VLADLRDDDGRPILTKLIRGRDAYQGLYADKGPDLHLELDHYNMIACPLFATEGKVMTTRFAAIPAATARRHLHRPRRRHPIGP
jgi:hypothetical protein